MTVNLSPALPTGANRWVQTAVGALVAGALALGGTAFFAPATASAKPTTGGQIDSWKECYDRMTQFESPAEADFDCCLVKNMKYVGVFPTGSCHVWETDERSPTPNPQGPKPAQPPVGQMSPR